MPPRSLERGEPSGPLASPDERSDDERSDDERSDDELSESRSESELLEPFIPPVPPVDDRLELLELFEPSLLAELPMPSSS